MRSEDDYKCWNSFYYTWLALLTAMCYELDEFNRHRDFIVFSRQISTMRIDSQLMLPEVVSPPRVRHVEMRTLSEVDIHVMLNEAKNTPYYNLFYLALFTGMRRSEILALRWADVDLIMAEISINRSMHRLQDGQSIFKSPKTDRARRTISLSPSTCQVLREHLDNQADIRSKLGVPLTDNDLVFSQLDGSPLIPHSVTQAWRRMVNRLGLRGIRLHDLRHTHASLMLKQGIHPKIVQERLGHSSVQITLDTYSHVAPGLQEAAAKGFDDIVNGLVSKRLAKTENGEIQVHIKQ